MRTINPSVFRHEQTTPQAIWLINHNLGSNGGHGLPIVDVATIVDGVEVKLIPRMVERINNQTVRLEFSIPRTGTAIIIV